MNDLISRQAMLDGIDKLIKIHFDRTVVLYKARKVAEDLPSVHPEHKDAIEKAVAVEAICDELMSRFDVSATYGYDFAEAVINRIEAMAKEIGKE
jgi:hypothetical protein